MRNRCLSDADVQQYHEKGYVVARGFFDQDEVQLLRRAAKEDRALDEHSYSRNDGEGGSIRLSLWNHPGIPFTEW